MSDTLIGVIIGGAIASVIPLVTLIIEQKKWKKEKRLDYLRGKREKLEKIFEPIKLKLVEAMQKDFYDTDMLSDLDFLVPDEVSEEFHKWMKEPERTPEKIKRHYYFVLMSMKKVLSGIDKEIEKECS